MKKILSFSFYGVLIALLVFVLMIFAINYFYPIKHKSFIYKYSMQYNLQPHFVASIINVESSFNDKATSKAGAIGLMQLMPTTAIEISNLIGDTKFNVKKLAEPETNIKYGCFYLNYLYNYFNGNVTNILASYNAGLTNVNKWLINEQYSSDGITIHKTPFDETNNFIKRVNNNIKFYKLRF